MNKDCKRKIKQGLGLKDYLRKKISIKYNFFEKESLC